MHTPLRAQSSPHPNSPFSLQQGYNRSACPVMDTDEPRAVSSARNLTPHRRCPSESTVPYPSAQATANPARRESLDLDHLDLSKLANFETVTDQYREQGVQFKNAIALHPSNPAFPPRTGQAIVLGGPKNGTIDLMFSPPVHSVEGYVTSSAVTMMTAFDHQNQAIGQNETLGRNLADQQSAYPPNCCLAVHAPPKTAIHRIRLRCGGGQVALTDLSFSRAHR